MVGRTYGFNFKLFHDQVGNEGANGGTHVYTMDLFIIVTLEEEVSVFETKLQQGDYLGERHGCPLWEKGVLV